jgi:hypothetical protein
MKKFVPIFFLFVSILFAGCNAIRVEGNGKIITENRKTTKFSKIEAGGAFLLRIKQGATESIVIQADENILPEIKSEVTGSTLNIGFSNKLMVASKTIIVDITVVNLEEIDISGSCDIEGIGEWHFNNFTLECSGATESVFTLFGNVFVSEASGSCNLIVKGRVNESKYEISGSGNVKASTLESKNVSLEVSGAGNAEVFATEFLSVESSGSSEVLYKGNPKITQDISGSGTVKPF